jgi:ribose transport system ATP-binding protein
MPSLIAEGVSKSFGPTQALKGVGLALAPGEVTGIVGENGSGKSTLMTILAGEAQPDEGRMTLAGHPYRPASPIQARDQGVCLIHQELALCPHLSAADNIFLVDKGAVFSPKQRLQRAREVLKEMEFSFVPAHVPVGTLPIAQRQAVEIARGWAARSRVVLFDEPTSSLGKDAVERLFRLIARLVDDGAAVGYISHFLEEVRKVAAQVVVLRDGEQVYEGALGELEDSRLISLMVGREVSDLYPRSPRTPGEPVLAARGATGHGGRPLDADLTLRKGEIVGVAGLAGSGRTELLRALFGLDRLEGGEVAVLSVPTLLTPRRAWQGGAGFVSEDRKREGLALSQSIEANISLAQLGGWRLSPRGLNEKARGLVEEFRIKCQGPGQKIATLSGGNQQKAALARLAWCSSQVVILDEPTRGIDVGSKAEIYRLLDRWAAEGKGILMAGSYLPELLGVCDRIIVMNKGRIAGEVDARTATPEAVLELGLTG